jgi:small-conductance mechanosensitive channel
MGDLFNTQRFAEAGAAIYQWLLMNVFVLGNAVQLLIILVTLVVSLVLARRLVPLVERLAAQPMVSGLFAAVRPLLLALIWLALLWLTILAGDALRLPHHLIQIGALLMTAWVVIRLVSQLAPSPTWAKGLTWAVWSVVALSILNLLDPTIAILDAAAFETRGFRISLYTVVKSAIALAILLTVAIYVARLCEARIRTSRTLSPSVQVLFTKTIRASLIGLSIVIGIHSLGIDLTALAVVGGALGLGAGFGLQKVISNMVSGVVLLIDRSIRPGDVISVSGTYGWVTALGGRYVSVVTRDGVEHLIPNETLISERVENWTHTNSHTRLKIPVRVAYDTDVHQAIDICVRAASQTERVLEQPECRCLLIAFGENGLELEVRIWIGDAHNGVQNVKSAVLLRIWEMFREAGIRVPYPQREVRVQASGGVDPRGAPPGAAPDATPGAT